MFRKNVSGQTIHFQGVDSATGGIKSGVTWTVRRCIDGTFAAGGGTVTEDGTTGWYKYAMSQADTNGNNIGFNFTGTGAIPQTVNIITTAADPTDAVRLGLTALPNANAEAAGGLYTRGTGAGQINQPADGQIDANVVKLGGTTQTGRDIGASVLLSSGTGAGQLDFTSGVVKANLAQILGTALTETAGQIAAAFKKFFDKASPTGTVNSIPDAVAGTSGGLALVGSDVGVASSVSGSVGSVTAGVTVSTNNDKTGYGLSSAAVQAIWDALTSALTTAGSIGKWILDKLDVVVSTRLASASYTAPLDAAGTRSAIGLASANLDTQLSTIDDFLDTEIAAIKAKTDNLPSDPADASDIAASFSTVNTKLDTIDDFLDTEVAAIKAKTDNLPASPAATSDIPTAGAIADQVWDETQADHVAGGSTGATINTTLNNTGTISTQIAGNLRINGFKAGSSVFVIKGGTISPSQQGESVVTVGALTIDYDNQFQHMLLAISDTNTGIDFVAEIKSSDATANTFTLSHPLPDIGAEDAISFVLLPAGMGDASKALVLYEGN